MNSLRNRKKINFRKEYVLLVSLLFITIGYALISITFGFNGNINVSSNKWDIHFDNIKVVNTSMEARIPASIDENNNLQINFALDLTTPGEYYEFTVDVVNNGTLDAILSNIDITELTPNEQKYLKLTVSYDNDDALNINDIITSSNRSKIKVKVEFLYDILESEIPLEVTSKDISIVLDYKQNK